MLIVGGRGRHQEAQQQDEEGDFRGGTGVLRQHGAQHPAQAGMYLRSERLVYHLAESCLG